MRAGIDDWGGVSPLTADHVNPERPWPHLDDLAALTAASGFTLQERLTAHPEYVRDADRWIDPALHAAVRGPGRSRDGSGEQRMPRPHPARRAPDESSTRPEPILRRRPSEPRTPRCRRSRAESPHGARGAGAGHARRRRVGRPPHRDRRRPRRRRRHRRRRPPLHGRRSRQHGRQPQRHLDASARSTPAEAADVRARRRRGDRAGCCRPRRDRGVRAGRAARRPRTRSSTSSSRARSRSAAPSLHLHAYRPQDIADLCDRAGLGLGDALAALKRRGRRDRPRHRASRC